VVQAARVILPGGDTLLVGADLDFFQTYAQPAWAEEPAGGRWVARGAEAGEAIVSESFAERFQVHRGAVIEVPSPTGPHSVTIAGVFSDYGNERGSLMISRETYVAWFGDELAANLILVLRPGQDPGALRAEFRKRFPGVAVFTQPHLRGEATRIFQQTFSITYALEVIGMAVAVAGLAFTMVSLLWERRDQLATLRALGMRRNEIAAAAAWEGALTAFGGVLIGVVASVALGLLLVFGVNKQTFGWTLEMAFPWGQIAGLAGLVIAAAAVTGWIAGRWGAQLPAEREEA
jgi:putative ABC transport system permease protein